MTTMRKAIWPGTCKLCSSEIKKGEVAFFEPGEDRISMFHVNCPPKPVQTLSKDGGKNGGKP